MRARVAVVLLLLFAADGALAEPHGTRLTIRQLTSIFENSTPELQYGYVENIGDRRGLTFGYAGFCSGTYDGTLFLREYLRLRPGNSLAQFLPVFEAIDAGPHDAEGRNPSTAGLAEFPAAFRACEGDPAFRLAQDHLVDRLYWGPSQRLARRIGARLPISRGELYDAFINHGADGARRLIRQTSAAVGGSPGQGIDERVWLEKFLAIRLGVLLADPAWRQAGDRVRVYERLLAEGNVRIERPIRLVCYGDRFLLW